MPEKRKKYITWDQYFMRLALLERSKDPKRQVGIKEVIYLDKPDHDESVEVAEVILKECGIAYHPYEIHQQQIILNL